MTATLSDQFVALARASESVIACAIQGTVVVDVFFLPRMAVLMPGHGRCNCWICGTTCHRCRACGTPLPPPPHGRPDHSLLLRATWAESPGRPSLCADATIERVTQRLEECLDSLRTESQPGQPA